MSVQRIGFAYNPTIEAAVELSARAAGWCQIRHIDQWQAQSDDMAALLRELPSTDALVVLGGDGTFLRAVRAVAEVDVPILGINLGKVGFLSKAEAGDLDAVLGRIEAGDYQIGERMALEGVILRDGRPIDEIRHVALNDIVVARGSLARVCRLDVAIDDSHLATFIADGLVISSPTGSTGYSFSAGGPIVDPVSRNLVVTPIAAYLSAIRSVVVSPRQVVRCRVVDAHEALVSVDGREDIPIRVGDLVEVRAVERPDPPHRTDGRAALLGPAAPQGRPAAVVTGRLLELAVTDLALIERLRLPLEPGFNVITGETGAGKSLIIDALGLALGARADTTLVRHGADTARVEALFDRLPEPLIAVREVAAGGRSTARVDDETVTAARLAEEVGPLVEIHGQHDQQRLLDERWQRDLLDGFGGHAEQRAAMAEAVEAWRANRAALAELIGDPRELARRLELLEYEAGEIAAARLRPGEADEIRARLAAAQHGEAIARGSAAVHEALTVRKRRRTGRRGARAARGEGRRSRGSALRAAGRSPGRPGGGTDRRRRRVPVARGDRRTRSGRAGRARGAPRDDLRPRAPLRRWGGRRHRPRRTRRGRGRAAARSRWRTGPARRRRCPPAGRGPGGGRAPLRGSPHGRRRDDGRGGRRARRAGLSRRRLRGRARSADRRPRRARGRARRRRRRLRCLRRRRGRVPPGPERRASRRARWRGSRPAASCSRVALAIKSGPRRGRRDTDARVRRGRLGHRRPQRGSGRAEPVDPRPPPPGPVRHAPAPDRGPRRRPVPDHEARTRRPDGHRGRAARSRGPDRRARPDARERHDRPDGAPGPAGAAGLAAARELLDRAEAWRGEVATAG